MLHLSSVGFVAQNKTFLGNQKINMSLDIDVLYQSFCCEILETPHNVLAIWMEGVCLCMLDMHILNVCVKWKFGKSKRSDDSLLKNFY